MLVLISHTAIQIVASLSVVGAMLFIYVYLEPRLIKLFWRDVFSCYLSITIVVPMVGAALSLLIENGRNPWLLLTTEPAYGSHIYTYASIAAVYLVSFWVWHDSFYAFLSSLLYPALHEAVWYSVAYLFVGATLIPFADLIFIVWIVTVIFIYRFKKYPRTNALLIGVCIMAAYQAIREMAFKSLASTTPINVYLEFGSWMLFFGFYLLHLRAVGLIRN